MESVRGQTAGDHPILVCLRVATCRAMLQIKLQWVSLVLIFDGPPGRAINLRKLRLGAGAFVGVAVTDVTVSGARVEVGVIVSGDGLG
jgi:hypothetical protein